jgi:ribonuclease P protein component
MKKTVSLKLNREFKSLYYRGGSTVSSLLVIYYRKNKKSENRLGLTVSKKTGNAVVRNRVRRLIKENYRLRENLIKDGYDIVIVARPRAADASFAEIGSALVYLLRKSGLIQ